MFSVQRNSNCVIFKNIKKYFICFFLFILAEKNRLNLIYAGSTNLSNIIVENLYVRFSKITNYKSTESNIIPVS